MSPAQRCGRESSKQSSKTCITSRFEAIKMALRDQESSVVMRRSRVNAGNRFALGGIAYARLPNIQNSTIPTRSLFQTVPFSCFHTFLAGFTPAPRCLRHLSSDIT